MGGGGGKEWRCEGGGMRDGGGEEWRGVEG